MFWLLTVLWILGVLLVFVGWSRRSPLKILIGAVCILAAFNLYVMLG